MKIMYKLYSEKQSRENKLIDVFAVLVLVPTRLSSSIIITALLSFSLYVYFFNFPWLLDNFFSNCFSCPPAAFMKLSESPSGSVSEKHYLSIDHFPLEIRKKPIELSRYCSQ